MFVITADQRGSRSHADLVPSALEMISHLAGTALILPAERTTGDELQLATADADAALEVALQLSRERAWSVGIGVGGVEDPLPRHIRAARGAAFIHARDAVERAKSLPTRLAVTAAAGIPAARDAEALMHLLIDMRDRRSAYGWELADLLAKGMSQKQAAAALGITESAVSRRAAVPALARVLDRLDGGA